MDQEDTGERKRLHIGSVIALNSCRNVVQDGGGGAFVCNEQINGSKKVGHEERKVCTYI